VAIVETGPVPAAVEDATAARPTRSAWTRLKPTVLALIVPLLLLAFWQVATTQQWTRLIPTPYAVAECMVRAPKLGKESLIIVNLSGRGDKDVAQVAAKVKLEMPK